MILALANGAVMHWEDSYMLRVNSRLLGYEAYVKRPTGDGYGAVLLHCTVV